MIRTSRAPWWFIVLLVLAAMPVFSTPEMIASCPSGNSTLRTYIMLFPVAVLASAYYSFVSYRERTLLAWIMLIFMVMIDASLLYLTMQ